MTTIKNLLGLIPDSFSVRRKERWGHYFPLIAEDAYGTSRFGFDILKEFQLCGPLVVVNRAKQPWSTDCVVTITYNHASQIQEATIPEYEISYIGKWIRGRLPLEDDDEFIIGFEKGHYFIISDNIVQYESDGVTPLSENIEIGEYMMYDGTEWVAKIFNWKTEHVFNVDIKLPIYSPRFDSGVIEEKEVVVTIPAGHRLNAQTFATSDYAYKITGLTVTGGDDQHIEVYCLSDSGIRLLNLYTLDDLEDIYEYMLRRYFPHFDPCPDDNCDYNCTTCGGYGYIDNPSEAPPYTSITSDWLARKYADAKGVKFEKNWERYRWRVWAKYWWVEPSKEKIKEFVGHFTGIDPDRIGIETTNYPELIWTIRIPVKDGTRNILGEDDVDYKSLVDDIVIAGGNIIIKDILIYYEGEYDDYYSDIIPLKVASYTPNVVTLDTDNLTLDYTWINDSITDMTAVYSGTGPYKITTTTNISTTYLTVGQRVLTKVYTVTPTLLATEWGRVGSINGMLIFYYDTDLGLTTENTVDVREVLDMIVTTTGTPNYEGVQHYAEFYDSNKLEFSADIDVSANNIIFLDTRHQKNVMDKVIKSKRLVDYVGGHIGKRNGFDYPVLPTYILDTVDVLTDDGGNDKVTMYDVPYYAITSHGDPDSETTLGCVKVDGVEYDVTAVEQGAYGGDAGIDDLRLTLSGFDYNTVSVDDEIKIYLNGYNKTKKTSADITDFDHYAKKLIYNECYYRV